MIQFIKQSLKNAENALTALQSNTDSLVAIEQAAKELCQSFNNGNVVYSCGNGGSMADAIHFAEEFTGRFHKNRPSLAAIAISDPGHITCTANDYGFEYIFSRFVEGVCKKGDILFAITTSGESKNVIKALEAAKNQKIKTIVLTGKKVCTAAHLADIHIATPSNTAGADRVQELHIKCIHIIIELCERMLFPKLYEQPQDHSEKSYVHRNHI